jgi:hypothetical protein
VRNSARFGVDPKLTSILGDTYRSSEKALCELIDNAWDADATIVTVTLPSPITNDPVVVADDGTGMTSEEVRSIYLKIANDRFSRSKDARTAGMKRLVKGRKGIGKFAGLAAADLMTLETAARGTLTRVTIRKSALLSTRGTPDLQSIDLPVESEPTAPDRRGTIITLSNLDQSKTFPKPELLRKLLVREYAREENFSVIVNGERLSFADLGGDAQSRCVTLPDIGVVTIKWTVSAKPLPKSEAGFVYRIAGKIVGQPTFCGLESREDIPEKVLHRVWGEIEADGLDRHVTADWGDIVENSVPLQQVHEEVKRIVAGHLEEVCRTEIDMARLRIAKDVKARIETLPEHRRLYAEQAVEKVVKKYFPEGEDKIKLLAGLILDAVEHDEYWVICERIAVAKNADVATIAQNLAEFGLVDLSVMVKQAKGRQVVLDSLEELVRNPKTLEAEVHKALEHNLWVLGPQYSVIASNQTLKTIIKDFVDKGGSRAKAKTRPDLFLGQGSDQRRLLIEFKRPSESVGRDAEAQARKYRDELSSSYGSMDLLVLGGSVDQGMLASGGGDTQFRAYMSVIATARTQLEWLLTELRRA